MTLEKTLEALRKSGIKWSLHCWGEGHSCNLQLMIADKWPINLQLLPDESLPQILENVREQVLVALRTRASAEIRKADSLEESRKIADELLGRFFPNT